MNTLKVSHSPHVYSSLTINRLMLDVIIALIPAFIVSIIFFGTGAAIVTLSSIAFCVLFEYLIQTILFKQKATIADGSAILTGLLLGLNLPSNIHIGIIAIGALVAIGVGKMTFGGLGNNPFNPALVGRVFMLVSFPVQMTSWPKPLGFSTGYLDAETGATVLGRVKEGLLSTGNIAELDLPSNLNLFIGNMGGSIGEVTAGALLVGFIYLLIRKVITWHIPVSVIGSIFIFAGILFAFSLDGSAIIAEKTGITLPVIHYMDTETNTELPFRMAGPLFHILAGGVFLGGIYMATDYVTSPMSTKGMIIFGVGIGIITVCVRVFGAYPEGMSFAILIMNAFTPLLNKYIKPKRFGEKIKA